MLESWGEPFNRCYFSFPTFYGKVKRNMAIFKKERGVEILDPDEDFKRDLAHQLAEIAYQHGISMNSCCGDYLVGGKLKKPIALTVMLSAVYFLTTIIPIN